MIEELEKEFDDMRSKDTALDLIKSLSQKNEVRFSAMLRETE